MHGTLQNLKMKPENLINIVALVSSLLVGAATVTAFVHSNFVPQEQYTKDQAGTMHRLDRIEDKLDQIIQSNRSH